MPLNRDRTCEERIASQLTDRIEQLAEVSKRAEDYSDDSREAEEARDEAQNELYELPLSVERYTTWKVLLSTGGPADWFEYQVDPEGDVGAIRYHFQDWFDHAERRLIGEEYDQAEAFGRAVTGDFYVDVEVAV